MGWLLGFMLGGAGGAVLGSAGAYMINNKKVEKSGEIKWEARIPQPLYMVRTGITATGIILGALSGAMAGGFVQSQFISFAGNHQKIVAHKQPNLQGYNANWQHSMR
jgi:uncharacterized membrane protein YfcA